MLNHSLLLSFVLMCISFMGLMIHRTHLIYLLLCVELMLLAVNINLVAFSVANHDIGGQAFVFFILTVAAAEAAIGLAIVVLQYRNRSQIDVDQMTSLKG